MDLRPTKIELTKSDHLRIEWSDGKQREISFAELRKVCPCATCRELRAKPPAPASLSGGLNVLSLAETRPLKILGMKPVGNYAYSITFSDGHDTGIFTLDFLRGLGSEVSG